MNKKDILYISIITVFSIFFIFLPININIFVKIGIIVLLYLIYSLKYLQEYLEYEEMVNNFPLFLRDLSHYLKIGQPLPVALKSVSNNYYGKRLNREIKYIISEMEYGKTFYDALNDSANRINNLEISEVLSNINNVLKSGGDLSNLLDTLSESIRNLEMIKKDRLSQLKLTTYTYYGLFLGVLLSIIAVYYLIINIKSFGPSFNKETYYELINVYRFLSFLLLLINAIFTGLVIGKLANGTIKSGIIHSIVLTIISIGFFFLL